MLLKIGGLKNSDGRKKDHLAELWSEIRAGNPEALSQLYHFSYPWLFNYGYKIAPGKALIKDAIQDLFFNLWNQKDYIHEAKSVKSYLYCSLRRIILRKLKRQKTRAKRNYIYSKNWISDIFNTEELIIHFETHQEKKRKLTVAVQSLSKRQKEVIYLKFYNGLSNSEIATVMGIKKQSVYNHVSEAICQLKEVVR